MYCALQVLAYVVYSNVGSGGGKESYTHITSHRVYVAV